MDRYRFERSVTVDGRAFSAGDEFAAGDIPADHLESCLRVGHVSKLPELLAESVAPPVEPPPDPPVESEPAPVETAEPPQKKRGR